MAEITGGPADRHELETFRSGETTGGRRTGPVV